jgi:membrane-associated protein
MKANSPNFVRLAAMFGFDLETLVRTAGYLGMFAIIFVETGLLVGFFLPGDTLLLTAGIIAASGKLELGLVIVVCALGSILGDQLGYFIGKTFGSKVFSRPQSRLFDPENVNKARAFFDKYGMLTIIVARFIPVIRAFAPTMAGVSGVPYQKFVGLSILGGVLWGTSVTSLGYFLGQIVGAATLEKYLLGIIAAGILAGVVPSVLHLLRHKKPADG